jgi:sirohydrochlorin cobaltochelatase
MRLPLLQDKPAVAVAAFGSNNRAKIALYLFEEKLGEHFPNTKIFWAYTSEIIRTKLGLPSLQKTIAKVDADGYGKAVVQPLHFFPGTEY